MNVKRFNLYSDILILIIMLLPSCSTNIASGQERIFKTKLLPTRQLMIGHQGDYNSVVWNIYSVIYRIENSPHICDDPNDPRRQFQFDDAYVISKVPQALKQICIDYDYEKMKCKRWSKNSCRAYGRSNKNITCGAMK